MSKSLQRFLAEDLSEYFRYSLRYSIDADMTIQVLEVTLSSGHKLEMRFPMFYPLTPPDIIFIQPFPNISGLGADGRVPYLGRDMCDWNPAFGIKGLLLTALILCQGSSLDDH
jgi:ubiquitin-protein ligase